MAVAAVAVPAAATVPQVLSDPASAYVAARAASIRGNHAQSAEIYAQLAARSSNPNLDRKAVEEAISAGNMPLALQLLGQSKQNLTVDSRILLVADALRRHRSADAIGYLAAGGSGNLSFWEPLIRAWDSADRGDSAGALSALSGVPRTSAFAPFVDEETAFILLKLRRTADAEPYARRAIGSAA